MKYSDLRDFLAKLQEGRSEKITHLVESNPRLFGGSLGSLVRVTSTIIHLPPQLLILPLARVQNQQRGTRGRAHRTVDRPRGRDSPRLVAIEAQDDASEAELRETFER